MEKCISPQGGGWGQKIFGCELWLDSGSTFAKTFLGSAISNGSLLADWANYSVLKAAYRAIPKEKKIYDILFVPYYTG